MSGPLRLLVLANAAVGHTQRWVDYFVDRGDEVVLASLEQGVPTRAREERLPSLAPLQALKYPLSVPFVRRIANRLDPECVVAHFVPNYGLVGALLGRAPLVVVAWGSDVLINPRRSGFHSWRARHVLGRADLVISDAKMLTAAIEELGVLPRRIETFTFGVDTQRFRPLEGPRSSPPVILSIRQLLPLYHVDLLVRAVPLVAERTREPFAVRVVGQGPERDRLKRLARELGVGDRVTFLEGRLGDEELIQEMRRATIYVSTSRSDTTSVSLLEAMACGVSPVVTDIPGNREWIEPGVNGTLVPLDDPEPLADALVATLEDERRWERVVEHNLRLVRGHADWGRNMERTRTLIGELVRAR